jgi:uncharacterized membrane protein YbhN (UPF0104 family)
MRVVSYCHVKAFRAALFVGGIAVLAYLVFRVGAGPLLSVLGRLAWWQFVLVCLPYGLIMAVDTLGWRYSFATKPPPYLRMLAARTAGEALNIVTALGSVGGEAVKVWLLRPAVPYAESVPSIVIAKTTSTIAQALFLLLGGGFLATQLTGLVRRVGRLLAWSGLLEKSSQADRLDANLRLFYRDRWRRFLLSIACHLSGWILGVLEVAVMLFVLDLPAGAGMAAVIETLGSGVRFAAFLVPGGLGVLEGAYTGIFAVLGLGAGAGLAFSLVRRARQIVWIGVGLLVLVAAHLQATSAGAVPRRVAR